MIRRSKNLTVRKVVYGCLYVFIIFLFCEYVIYYVVLLSCSWPQIQITNESEQVSSLAKPLKFAIIADVHLLGSLRGHWFDKLRREWQMYRSFQSMMYLFEPSVVFFLGDLFDEGLWSNDNAFNSYVQRFHSLFATPVSTKTYVVAGNHDMGFHYSIRRPLDERFINAFNAPAVNVLTIKGNNFVLINSMAMEGDGCTLCRTAERELQNVSIALKCTKNNSRSYECENFLGKRLPNTRPVLLQHFPMYRASDSICEGPDASPPKEKDAPFREKWECLSKRSSDLLFDLLKPRLIFGGHTHHGCYVLHDSTVPEWTVPSFSWRNRNNPSFLLVTLTPQHHAISKCFLPQESTVIILYALAALSPVIWSICRKVYVVTATFHSKLH